MTPEERNALHERTAGYQSGYDVGYLRGRLSGRLQGFAIGAGLTVVAALLTYLW